MSGIWRSAVGHVLAGLALLLFSIPAAQADWQDGAGPAWANVLSAAKKEGKVVIAGHPALARPFSEGFKRDTGIDLEYLGGNPRELTARFSRELRSESSTIDIMLGGGSEILNLYPEGRLVSVKAQLLLPGVLDPKNWQNGAIKWMDKQGEYFFQGANWVHAWALVNSQLVPPASLRSWKDLLKPEFKGRIAAYDPRSGGQGQAAAAYLAHTFGIDFVKALYAGQEVVFTRDGRQLVEWLVRGSHAIALGAVQIDVESFRARGFRTLAVPELSDGPGLLTGGFGLLKQGKGSPHPNAATVFINWYASKPGQEAYARVMLEPSTRSDVAVPGMPDYVIPKTGVQYVDQFQEDWYRDVRPKLEKSIVDTLGGP